MIATMAGAGAAALRAGATMQRRMAEQELLHIGSEFRAALASYAAATPAGQPTTPRSLQDLLKDPRYPDTRRHLRKVYADPITGKKEWGIVYSPQDHGVIGVHSLSPAMPIKTSSFGAGFQNLEGKRTYAEWVFSYVPK